MSHYKEDDVDPIDPLGPSQACLTARKIAELERQLAASEKARKTAEAKASDFYSKWDAMRNLAETAQAELAATKRKIEAAEQRIKESQDQEPAFVIHDELGNTHNLYKQPPIPPEVEELQRTTESLTDMLTDALEELKLIRAALGVEYEPHQSLFDRTLEACRSSAELTKKLAEQQALNSELCHVAHDAINEMQEECECDSSTDHTCKQCAFGKKVYVLENHHPEELAKFLEEAKRQAVPEGMITLPTTCPECGTKDIEYACMCHNSKCKGYAMEFSVYEGWRAAQQSERKD